MNPNSNPLDNLRGRNKRNPSKDKQKQLLRQDKVQLQNQKLTNFSMATVLSTAEHLCWRLCEKDKECLNYLISEYSKIDGFVEGKLIFNHYNSCKSGIDKSINSLTNQFIFQIENFEDDYSEFKEKYTNYSFPNNMKKNQILNIIDLWMLVLGYNHDTKSYLNYFQNLKNIFINIPIISYEEQVRAQYKGNPRSGKADPRVIQTEYAKAINFIDDQTKDIDNQNLELWK